MLYSPMLIDKICIQLNSGKGGDGAVHFDIMRRPSGGDGGKGGDIYVVGTNSLYDLSKLNGIKKIVSEDGERGGKSNKKGKSAKDITIKLPITTVVKNGEVEICRITKIGQKELIIWGGEGGIGNFYFRHGQMTTRTKFTPGKDGMIMDATFELNLNADVLFIGFPNAGKSSMLNLLTNANVKVAPYPFTTLEPHLGVARDLILMDLPGFIEGVSKGKGVGKGFIKHFTSARLVAHFISLEESDLLGQYNIIKTELGNLGKDLLKLPEIIVLSKSDMFSKTDIDSKLAQLGSIDVPKIITSSFDYSATKGIVNFFVKYIKPKLDY